MRLRREKRNEEIRRVGETLPFVDHGDFDTAITELPADADTAIRLERCIDRIAHEIDEQLVELIAIRAYRDVRTVLHLHREPRLESRRTMNPVGNRYGRQSRRG